jgi:hypothetical protein
MATKAYQSVKGTPQSMHRNLPIVRSIRINKFAIGEEMSEKLKFMVSLMLAK